jgi:hypothetical protein
LIGFAAHESACLTKVDFRAFPIIKAKIDRIDFRVPDENRKPRLVAKHQEHLTGKLVLPKGKQPSDARGRGLAIHDPTLADLQYLTNHFHDAAMLRFELAVDAHLPKGSNELWRLAILKAQLRHCLFPQSHMSMACANRKYFNLECRLFKRDGLGTAVNDNMAQIIWESPDVENKLGLYIKEVDQGAAVMHPHVRIEARLFGNGLGELGFQRLGMLAAVAPRLRTLCVDMFYVADGFKNNAEVAIGRGVVKNPWEKWGAQWKVKQPKALLRPDRDANERIGLALNNLRTELLKLEPPVSVADHYSDWIEEMSY